MTREELGHPYYDRKFVSAIELAAVAPSFGALVHFARRLKIPLSELLKGV